MRKGETTKELVPLLSFVSSGNKAQIIRFAGQAFSPAPKLRLLLSHSLTRKPIFAKYLWLPKTYKEASPIDFLDVFPSEG